MKNDKIDQLIDSAFAKDKAGLPQPGDAPPASLMAKVKTTAPIAHSGFGLLSSLTAKIITGLVIMGGAVAVMFLLTRPEDVTRSPAQAPSPIRTIDSVGQLQVPVSTLQDDTTKPRKKRTGGDSIQLNDDPNKLIMPSTPPNVYEKDKATGTIKKQ